MRRVETTVRPTLNEKMRHLLEEKRFAVIGTVNPNGTPHLTVMWYELRDGEILFNTARGRIKDRNLRRDPHVSFVVEDGYRFLRIDGRVARVEDQATAQEDIRRLAVRYQGPQEGERMARETFAKQERITYRIAIERVYAPGLS